MSSLMIGKQSMLVSSAKEAYKYLHGTINVYKPAGISVKSVIRTLKLNLSESKFEMLNHNYLKQIF